MSKEQKALIRLKTQNSELRIFRIFCFVLCVLSLIYISSSHILAAEEEQSEADQYREVSITTGPDGKVSWFLNKNMGIAHGAAVVEYGDIVLKADHI